MCSESSGSVSDEGHVSDLRSYPHGTQSALANEHPPEMQAFPSSSSSAASSISLDDDNSFVKAAPESPQVAATWEHVASWALKDSSQAAALHSVWSTDLSLDLEEQLQSAEVYIVCAVAPAPVLLLSALMGSKLVDHAALVSRDERQSCTRDAMQVPNPGRVTYQGCCMRQASAELAAGRAALAQASAELAAERAALLERAGAAERATCALIEQHQRDLAELGALPGPNAAPCPSMHAQRRRTTSHPWDRECLLGPAGCCSGNSRQQRLWCSPAACVAAAGHNALEQGAY